MSQIVGNTTLAFSRQWRHVNAKNAVLGHVASKIAVMLIGKEKPVYDPSVDCGDYVVCTNAKDILLTGKKQKQKEYWRYSTHPGNQKITPYRRMMEENPEFIIRNAVSKMLPKNKLRRMRLDRLRIFPGEEHPHEQNITKHYDLEPPSTSTEKEQTSQ